MIFAPTDCVFLCSSMPKMRLWPGFAQDLAGGAYSCPLPKSPICTPALGLNFQPFWPQWPKPISPQNFFFCPYFLA